MRVTRERPGVTIDVFAASVMRAVPNRLNIPEPGTHVYGVNIALARVLPCVTLEPYVFARRAPNQALELGGRDALHSATIGGRWTVATRTAFDIGGEMAGQLGSIGDGPIRAWAGHRTVGFIDASFAWKPRVFAEYNYASGDDNAHDGRRQTFDQLYGPATTSSVSPIRPAGRTCTISGLESICARRTASSPPPGITRRG